MPVVARRSFTAPLQRDLVEKHGACPPSHWYDECSDRCPAAALWAIAFLLEVLCAENRTPAFADRREAGTELAEKLKRYAGRTDVVVLALHRRA